MTSGKALHSKRDGPAMLTRHRAAPPQAYNRPFVGKVSLPGNTLFAKRREDCEIVAARHCSALFSTSCRISDTYDYVQERGGENIARGCEGLLSLRRCFRRTFSDVRCRPCEPQKGGHFNAVFGFERHVIAERMRHG